MQSQKVSRQNFSHSFTSVYLSQNPSRLFNFGFVLSRFHFAKKTRLLTITSAHSELSLMFVHFFSSQLLLPPLCLIFKVYFLSINFSSLVCYLIFRYLLPLTVILLFLLFVLSFIVLFILLFLILLLAMLYIPLYPFCY